MKTVIGIDVGTQSTKVVFYDIENRKAIATETSPHQLHTAENGTSEQNAEWWLTAIEKAFAAVPASIRTSAVAVGVSGQQHGFVPVDNSGNVLYPVKLWNDTSTSGECDQIISAFGGEPRLYKEVGNTILPGYTASKILWFKQTHPQLFSKLQHIMLPHDYINFILTGNAVMEYGDASGTGLLNIRTRTWNRELCDIIDPRLLEMLPPLKRPSDGAGVVSYRASKRFGIPENIPVSTGGGDNMMAAIGTGTVHEGYVAMSLGTSGTLFAHTSRPVIDNTGTIAAFCSSDDGWLPLLCTMNCTVATEQTRKLFGFEIAEIDETANSIPPGSNGVVVLPFFTGERIPNLPRAKAGIMGLNMNNTSSANVLRASMEAAIFGMKLGLDALENLGVSAKSITLTGGGSRSLVWRQIAADITETPVIVPANHDSAALGAAIQALWYSDISSGMNPDANIGDYTIEHILGTDSVKVNPGEGFQPYRAAYNQYKDYIAALTPIYR